MSTIFLVTAGFLGSADSGYCGRPVNMSTIFLVTADSCLSRIRTSDISIIIIITSLLRHLRYSRMLIRVTRLVRGNYRKIRLYDYKIK